MGGPPALYKWHVEAITADVTPYIRHPEESRRLLRDASRIKYEQVISTDFFSKPGSNLVTGVCCFFLHVAVDAADGMTSSQP
jgi:hypothetical protein